MVSVAKQHDGQILFMTFLKPFRISAAFMRVASKLFSLQNAPLVKGLIHHIKAHPVTEIQQTGIRRIMRHTDGVYPHVFQLLKPPLPNLNRNGRPHASAVMMNAHAVELLPLSINQKALAAIKGNAADSGRNADLILLFSICPQDHFHPVKDGMLR